MRVIEWIVRRTYNKVGAKETVLGWMPNYKDMTWRGLQMTEKQFDDFMTVDKKLALQDVNSQGEYFEQFLVGDRLPSDMDAELVLLANRLSR
jgi:phosphoenolpyruvate carboxykinase (GTP)